MKLKDIYEFIIKEGIKEDPRGKAKIDKELKNLKQKYAKLDKEEKALFDKESLVNPYADTRILYGRGDTEVKTIMVGIDMEVGELLLADRLKSKGDKVDLVMAHHPEGLALAGFYRVMDMQIDILASFGVPEVKAENLIHERIDHVSRSVLPVNHTRAVDAAKLLDMPYMCCHTPADNHVVGFLQKMMDSKKPRSLEDILKVLRGIPEYQYAAANNAGPKIINGKKSSRTGRIFVDMTGGTEGSKKVFENLSNAGIGTLVCMHLSEDHLKEAKKAKVNVVIAGHISSDNLGLNLLLDKIEKKAKINVKAASGFFRVKR